MIPLCLISVPPPARNSSIPQLTLCHTTLIDFNYSGRHCQNTSANFGFAQVAELNAYALIFPKPAKLLMTSELTEFINIVNCFLIELMYRSV